MATINSFATGETTGILTPGASARRFAYIDTRAHYNDKETEINTAFKDSLIVIGDEERAFIPVLNSYIGPNKNDINDLIKQSSDLVVTSLNGMSKNNYVTRTDDAEINSTSDFDYNSQLTYLTNKHSTSDLFGESGLLVGQKSGITVSSYITYKYNNEIVKLYSYEPNFTESVAYYKEHPENFIGSYVTIDDSKTIKYIQQAATSAIAYSAEFTTAFTDQQINKIYKEIIGIDYIPVDFANGKGVEDARYIKLNHAESERYLNGGKGLTYFITIDSQYIETTASKENRVVEDNTTIKDTANVLYDIHYGTIGDGENINDVNYNHVSGSATLTGAVSKDETGYYVTVNVPANSTVGSTATAVKVYVDPSLWGKNEAAGASVGNITNAITTISKVAEILDKITDGAKDGGISLAYSIADNRMDIDVLSNKVESLISPVQGPDNSISNVNSIKVENESHFIALTVTGNYTNDTADTANSTYTSGSDIIQDVDWSSGKKGGDVSLKLSTTLGVIGASNTTTTYETNHKTISNFNSYTMSFDGAKNGLATTQSVTSYVATATQNILGMSASISYSMITSLNVSSDTGDLQSNTSYIYVVDTVGQNEGLVTDTHKQIGFANKRQHNDGTWFTTEGTPVITSLTKDAKGTTVNITTHTATLEHYATHYGNTSYENSLVTVGNIYSYLMNLISWVDLSKATKQ